MEQHSSYSINYLRFVALTALLLAVSACGAKRPMEPWTCAVVGAAVGGVGGIAVGAWDHGDDSTDHTAVPTAAGAVVGALTGYAVCALLPEAAPSPPAAK